MPGGRARGTPLRLRTRGFMPLGRARGKNLEHLGMNFFLVWNYSYLNNRYYLGETLSLSLCDFRP